MCVCVCVCVCVCNSVNLRSGEVQFGARIYLRKFIYHGVERRDGNEELESINHHKDNERMKQEYKLTTQLTSQPSTDTKKDRRKVEQ